MAQIPTVPPLYTLFLSISSLPGHRRPHLPSLSFPTGHHLISPSDFTLFHAAGACFRWSSVCSGEGLGPFHACLFFFFCLVALTAPGADRQPAGPVFPRKEREGWWWGRQWRAQLAGGIEMAPRDPILGLGARLRHHPDVCMEQAGRGSEFLPR